MSQSIRIDIEQMVKLQLLIIERSILEVEVESMKADNLSRTSRELAPAYYEDDFINVADKMQDIKDRMNLLLTEEQIIKRGKK